MKKGDSLQLKYAWWNSNRPGALASTGLGAALKEYEKNKARHGLALAALDKVDAARQKGIRLCLGPAFADTKNALQRDNALTQAKAAHLATLDKTLDKIEESLRALETHIPNAEKFYAAYTKAPESKPGQEARKKFNTVAKTIGDNLTSVDTKVSDLFQQKAALQSYNAVWNRVTAAKKTLADLKPQASTIRLNAQDV